MAQFYGILEEMSSLVELLQTVIFVADSLNSTEVSRKWKRIKGIASEEEDVYLWDTDSVPTIRWDIS